MTLAEKLIFLADRVDDGKEFIVSTGHDLDLTLKAMGNQLYVKGIQGFEWFDIKARNLFQYDEFKLKPQWEFTEDEKAILRNLPEEYSWITRTKDGVLQLHPKKPKKQQELWYGDNFYSLDIFNHLFQSVQWEDEEPCEFRRYI